MKKIKPGINLKLLTLSVIWISVSVTARGQSFPQFLAYLNGLPEIQRQSVADSFMNATTVAPLIENDTQAYFVYNAPAESVALAGDATGWSPDQHFTKVTGTNFRYLEATYEADARLDYKLVINTQQWILDPKNPHTCNGGYGPNSELRMPVCPVPPETAYYSNIPHGTVSDTSITSTLLGNTRKVRIYLPAGYPGSMTSYPVILFHDGPDYLNLCKASNILDYLIANHLIAPVIALFVPPVDRDAEYAGSKKDDFTSFIVNQLMPAIDNRYKTSRDPAHRAMTGASNGGNISLYIGMKHPETFGKIAAQSSNVITDISQGISTGPKLNLQFYLDIGTYDIDILIDRVHGFRDVLQSKGYDYQFREWHEGHSWGNWKEHLRLPLMQFFPYTSGLNEPAPGNSPFLLPNRPNPFFGKTVIPYEAAPGSDIEISLFGITGIKLRTLFSGLAGGRENEIEFENHFGEGQFIVTLSLNNKVVSSRLINAL